MHRDPRTAGLDVIPAHEALRAALAPELPAGLLAHIDRVVAIAERLARRHGLDIERAMLGAQAHDVCRAVAPEDLLARAERYGWPVSDVERGEPVLLHGPVGAIELAARYGLDDSRVLHAVRWHTSGHPDFDAESWTVFVADKVDPQKVERLPALQRVADLAETSIEAAALAYLDLLLTQAVEQRWSVLPAAIDARNALLARLERVERASGGPA